MTTEVKAGHGHWPKHLHFVPFDPQMTLWVARVGSYLLGGQGFSGLFDKDALVNCTHATQRVRKSLHLQGGFLSRDGGGRGKLHRHLTHRAEV